MILPAGEHKVEFKFEPKVYRVGEKISLVSSIILILDRDRACCCGDPEIRYIRFMKRVLIITYYWPPSGGAGVQRWLKFSKYLREFRLGAGDLYT